MSWWCAIFFRNKHRDGEFLILEGRSTNILADRLKRLEAVGIIKRELYQTILREPKQLPISPGAELAPDREPWLNGECSTCRK